MSLRKAKTANSLVLWLCLAWLAIPHLTYGQQQTKLSLDLSGSFQSGWWLYNRGSTDPNAFNNLGWDRTDNKPTLGIGGGLLYHWGRVKVGLGGDHSLFFEDFMEAFEDTDSKRMIFRISNGVVEFWKYFLQAEYELIRKKRYTFSPNLKLGSFEIQSSHPGEENFGAKLYWEIGLVNEITFSRINLVIKPELRSMTIKPKRRKSFNQQHEIKGFGISVGLRIPLIRSKRIHNAEDATP